MRRGVAAGVALAIVLTTAGCSTQPSQPTVTVTATAPATSASRTPNDPLTALEALAFCEAKTLRPSPHGDLPLERIYDLEQVVLRDDGQWFVVIDEYDPNPHPDGHYNPDGASWSVCILGGTVGNVTWRMMGSRVSLPPSDPNYVEGIDYDVLGHD